MVGYIKEFRGSSPSSSTKTNRNIMSNPTEEELILFQEIDEIGNMLGYGQYENKSDEYDLDLKLCGCNKYGEGLIIVFEEGLYSPPRNIREISSCIVLVYAQRQHGLFF